MTDTFALAVLGCFLWGMVSVLFSPCHLASIPLMVGYVAGQGHEIQGREAAGYAGVFSLGLFLSIAVVGVICSLLGRMLGDISPLWGVPVGVLLVWLGLDLMGVATQKVNQNLSNSGFMKHSIQRKRTGYAISWSCTTRPSTVPGLM